MEICLIDIVSCTLLDVAVMCVALWMLNREWYLKYLHLVASICMEILAIMGTIGILVIIWRDILGGF